MSEQATARRLIRAAIARGYSITINDGEETVLRRSTKERDIMEALGSTGEDYVRVIDSEGNKVAVFYLVWGNDPDGSELIADCGTNELCDELYRIANKEEA